MNIFEKLIPVYKSNNMEVEIDDRLPIFPEVENTRELLDFISKLKNISSSREDNIKLYTEMAKDSIVGPAIQLIADEATQLDPISGMSYWIQAKDKKLEKDINDWLSKTIKINSKSWTYAYNIIKYGELFLRTHDSNIDASSDNLVVGDYLEIIENPNRVKAIERYGKVIGYQYEETDNKVIICDTSEFIHFICDKGNIREQAKIRVRKDNSDEVEEKDVKILVGSSFIEDSRQSWLIMDLIENILLTSRISRSTLYRLVQVEVGTSDNKQTKKMINEIKRIVSSKEYFKKDDIYKSNSSSIPLGANVYTSKRNGKGEITVETVGGDVDVKDIVDVDYFRNKLFASLQVPKTFLGFDELAPGGIGNSSLTVLDIRFARTVKRVKSILCEGIQSMVAFKARKLGYSDSKIEDIIVKTSTVSTAEDIESKDSMTSKLSISQQLIDTLLNNFGDNIDSESLLIYVVNFILELQGSESFIKQSNATKKVTKKDGDEV